VDHRRLMTEAIDLTRHTRPHPNPRVGAIVLDAAGSVVARAVHEAPGYEHAEALALASAGESARGGTVVVTLEPCNHAGLTPPCTEAILSSGVSSVVIGARDPDTRVDGSGIARLRAAGIEVVEDVAPAEVEAVDPAYFHHRRTGRPLVTLKWAATLDGQAAAADGTSQWITSVESRLDAHVLRADSDAIVVGAGTLIADDPALNVRIPDYEGPEPMPIVVAGRRPLPTGARLWGRGAEIYAPMPLAIDQEVTVLPGPGGVDLAAMVGVLGARGVVSILVEGGPTLAGALWRLGLIDRIVVYLGAVVAGGVGRTVLDGVWETLGDARRGEIVVVERLGPDIKFVFVPGGE